MLGVFLYGYRVGKPGTDGGRFVFARASGPNHYAPRADRRTKGL